MTKPSYEERELGDARIALDAEYDAALKEFNSRPLHVGLFLTRRQWFEARVLDLHVDLARVRGLLQRSLSKIANASSDLLALRGEYPAATTIALELAKPLLDCEHTNTEIPCGECFRDVTGQTYEQRWTQGAESADIGKLDAADKKENMNCHWNCNEPRFYGNACRVHAAKILNESCDALEFLRMLEMIPCTPRGAAEWLAGSAETGGEKADHD